MLFKLPVFQWFFENGKMVLWVIAFLFKQISLAECNYDISNNKVLAIVWIFEEWY